MTCGNVFGEYIGNSMYSRRTRLRLVSLSRTSSVQCWLIPVACVDRSIEWGDDLSRGS